MSGRARYATRLLVVMAIIGAIVGLGFVWRVSPAAGIVADGGGRDGRRLPPGVSAADAPSSAPAAGTTDGDRFERRDRGSGGLSLSRADDLVQTMVLGAGVLAVVVLIDRTRRRRRPVVDRGRTAQPG
jgi:hypothetical protein